MGDIFITQYMLVKTAKEPPFHKLLCIIVRNMNQFNGTDRTPVRKK